MERQEEELEFYKSEYILFSWNYNCQKMRTIQIIRGEARLRMNIKQSPISRN